jgi:hypothetical protein
MTETNARDHERRWLPAIGLFLLAPLIGEFGLGNQPITDFAALALYAPMYGGGALLIREIARRTGSGWPTIILLAMAYALVEEGLIDQMLFNPGYLGLTSFADWAPIPRLGISADLTYASLSIHTVWSICVPIALVEAFDRRRPRPWLGPVSLTIVAVIFFGGSIGLGVLQYQQFKFIGTVAQFAVTGAVVLLLILVALTVARRRSTKSRPRPAPRPAVVAAWAVALASAYWGMDILVPERAGAWVAVGCWAVLALFAATVLIRCSRRDDWGPAHRVAVAAGALLAYVWVGFVNTPQTAVAHSTDLIGNAVFGTVEIIIIALAVRAARAPASR